MNFFFFGLFVVVAGNSRYHSEPFLSTGDNGPELNIPMAYDVVNGDPIELERRSTDRDLFGIDRRYFDFSRPRRNWLNEIVGDEAAVTV